jgi:NAD(P)-dependent dehydrogenase (short-subunit alcohol dehydrogenase family)
MTFDKERSDSISNPHTEPSMHGRICLVTGANSGIGKATATELARMGAPVLMVCRDRERGEQARGEIARDTGNAEVELFIADLASQQSIRTLSDELHQHLDHLNVLVNNAGTYLNTRQVTPDGFEATFAINHLGYFLLTNLLLDLLETGTPARLVNVSSGAHLNAHIDFDDLQSEQHYSGWKAYGQSKLANVMFTYELARRVQGRGVTVNAVHPGVVRTNFGSSGGFVRFGARIAAPFLLSPEKGADTVIWLASSPEVEGMTGKYFLRRKPSRTSADARDRALQERLWQVSTELTHLSGAAVT